MKMWRRTTGWGPPGTLAVRDRFAPVAGPVPVRSRELGRAGGDPLSGTRLWAESLAGPTLAYYTPTPVRNCRTVRPVSADLIVDPHNASPRTIPRETRHLD